MILPTIAGYTWSSECFISSRGIAICSSSLSIGPLVAANAIAAESHRRLAGHSEEPQYLESPPSLQRFIRAGSTWVLSRPSEYEWEKTVYCKRKCEKGWEGKKKRRENTPEWMWDESRSLYVTVTTGDDCNPSLQYSQIPTPSDHSLWDWNRGTPPANLPHHSTSKVPNKVPTTRHQVANEISELRDAIVLTVLLWKPLFPNQCSSLYAESAPSLISLQASHRSSFVRRSFQTMNESNFAWLERWLNISKWNYDRTRHLLCRITSEPADWLQ